MLVSQAACFTAISSDIYQKESLALWEFRCRRIMLCERKVPFGFLSVYHIATVLDSRMEYFSFGEAREGPRSGYLCLFSRATCLTALSSTVYQADATNLGPKI